MAFHARRRRSSGQRSSRKTYWHGGFSYASGFTTVDGGWASGWVRYPSGYIDPNDVNQMTTPSDETLVRTIVNTNVALAGGPLPGLIQPIKLCLGLIAFDGGNPALWDNNTGGSLPTPAAIQPPLPIQQPGEDWIIRLPFCWTTSGTYQGPAAETFIESQAKRKLPPGTGILAVWELASPFTSGSFEFFWSSDFRMAVRSGYTV